MNACVTTPKSKHIRILRRMLHRSFLRLSILYIENWLNTRNKHRHTAQTSVAFFWFFIFFFFFFFHFFFLFPLVFYSFNSEYKDNTIWKVYSWRREVRLRTQSQQIQKGQNVLYKKNHETCWFNNVSIQ